MDTNGRGRETRSGINWQEIYAQLEQQREALEAGGPPPEEVKRILTARAKALAEVREQSQSPAEVLELLVFSIDREHYGVEPIHVSDVAALRRFAPIPGTPPFVLGVMNHRSGLRAVLDLRRLLDHGGEARTEGKWVVGVEAGETMFGIACDAVAGIVRIGTHELAPPPATLSAGRRAFVRGVTADMVTVLDLEALARDPRIVVNDEMG
ncbi:MAG: purine-binding chemotaxis protein CheW [Candidatus Rokubacteria bacterium]|nr:purine-binding chemotaxis protein CheW [Candidatus Rokubacteria bacterium]